MKGKPLSVCTICGKSFKRKKQSRAITCSKECSIERKRRFNVQWSRNFRREFKEKSAEQIRNWARRNKEKIRIQGKKAYNKNKDKFIIRTKTRQENEKKGVCSDCKKAITTEFHHLSYEPNIFIEVCRKCHNKRHGRNTYVK